MNRALLGLVLPGLLVVSGGTALVIASTGANIASDVSSRATHLLENPEFSWAAVDADIRHVVLTGTATDKAALEALVAQISELPGVRSVENAAVLADFASPFPFSARREGDAVILQGGLPDESIRAALAERLPGADDQLKLLSGAPARPDFQALVDYAITVLSHLDTGSVVAEDLDLVIEGRAASQGDFAALAELRRQGPPSGIRVVRASIAPPFAEPYEIIAKNDGGQMEVSGVAPDNRVIARIAELDLGPVSVTTSLDLASGVPQNFVDNALLALENLGRLDYGEARISGEAIVLAGAPPDAATAEAVTEAMAAIGASVNLEPPRVADYRLTGTKDPTGLSFIGSVPDAATRSRLAQTDAADVAAVGLARGAPEAFSSGLDFALGLLSRLSEGEVSLESQGLTVSGRALASADFEVLETMLAQPGNGVAVISANIRPPLASPFTWSADKAGDGEVTLSGHVPTRSVKAEIAEQFEDVGTDLSQIADGAPSGFAAQTAHAVTLLAQLASGRVAFDGANWQVSGTVATPASDVALRRYLARNDLLASNWSTTAALPPSERAAAPELAEPFIWRAEKSANGDISFGGFSPSRAFRELVALRATDSSDTTTVSQGAPAGFGADALAGLDGLLLLDSGVLSFDGDRWSLSGQSETTADRQAARAVLEPRWTQARWQFVVDAQDVPPVASPYTFMAARASDGVTTLSGHLLSEDFRRMALIKAGAGAVDLTVLATGEPSGFVADVLAGLDALAALESGLLSYDGTNWSLSGAVRAEEDQSRVDAALSMSARGISSWNRSIALPPAPEVPAETAETEVAAIPPADPVPEQEIVQDQPVSAPGDEPAGVSTEPAVPESAPSDAVISEPVASEPPAQAAPQPDASEITEVEPEEAPQVALAPPTGIDAREAPVQAAEALASLAQCQAEVDALASRNAILFRSGSDAITEDSLPVIDELAGYIAHCPGAVVHVEGHTDADGAEDLNLALSVARAEAVVFALMDRGVALDRLYALGYGESLPIADNETAAGKQRNRRIEFKILEDNR